MADRVPVWVTGAAVMAGGAPDLAAFDAMLRATRPGIGQPIGEAPWESWVNEITARDPETGRRARRVARMASTPLRTSLRVAVDAMRSAGSGAGTPSESVGVVVAGSNLAQDRAFLAAEKMLAEPAFLSPRHGYEFYDTHVMGVIAEALDLRGPGLTVGGASASGNVAVGVALDLIRCGRADACLVVGPMPALSPVERQALTAMGALAAPGQLCRPFDRAARGFVPGEACGAIVLERSDRAAARGAVPLAEVAGACWVQGANHQPAPDLDSEMRAMTGAMRDAGIGVGDLDLVSAHATSTPAGDVLECEALRRVLGDRRSDIAINAPKSLFGHGLHAAGIVETIAIILQMRGGYVHGTAHLENPIADDLGLLGPSTIQRPVRHALNNGFGFASIAASVVLRGLEDRG